MKKIHLLGAMAMLALTSCNQNDYNGQNLSEADLKRENDYMLNWIRHFDVPNEQQDWCLLRAVSADISTASMGEGVTTRLYSADPATGGNVLAVAQHDGNIRFDMRKGIDRVFGEVIDAEGNILAAGMYGINDGEVRIDGSANEGSAPTSRYAHDESNGGSWFNAMIACEDLGSAADSDFDFNDIVFGLHRVAGTNALEITPMAAGGKLAASISIIVGDERHDIGDSHNLIRPGQSGKMINTYNPFPEAGQTITIEVPNGWTIADAWAQQKFVITVNGKGTADSYELTSPAPGTAPKMILLDGDWYWPVETKSIEKVYSGFKEWAQGTGEKADWVDSYTSLNDVVAWDISKVCSNWFSATSTGPNYQAKIDNSRTATINSDARYYMNPATSTANMFSGRTDITSVDITGDHFNTASVISTASMFEGCKSLETINLSGWNTSSLENASKMFYHCSKLGGEIDLSAWDTRKLTDIKYMFSGSKVEVLTLDGWDFSNVTDYINFVYDCGPLHTVNLNNATIIHKLSKGNTDGLFHNSYSTLSTINARNCKIKLSDLGYMFPSSIKNLDIRNWDISEATSLANMFSGCSSIETINLSSWDISKITSVASLFNGLKRLTTLNIDGWKTSNLEDASYMFYNCSKLGGEIDLSAWDTSKLTDIKYMFSGSNVEVLTLDGWDFSNVTDYINFVYDCGPLHTVNLNNATIIHKLSKGNTDGLFHNAYSTLSTINARNCKIKLSDLGYMFPSSIKNLDISNWDISEATSLANMFSGCSSIETIDLSSWNVSKITSFANLFNGLKRLTTLNIDGWQTSNLEDASYMFYNCSKLGGEIDLSAWDTRKLTDIKYMFSGSKVEVLTLDGWDFSNVTDYINFVYDCGPLHTVNLNNATIIHKLSKGNTDGLFHNSYSTLSTINARNCKIKLSDLGYMFPSSIKNLDISNWNISEVTSVSNMFSGCGSLQSVNLMGWNIPSSLDTSSMLSGCNRSTCTIICSAATQAKLMADNSNLVVNWDIR